MENANPTRDDDLKGLLHRLHEVTKLQRRSQDQADYLIHRMMRLFDDDRKKHTKKEEGREGNFLDHPVHVMLHRSYNTVGKRLSLLRALSGKGRGDIERIYGIPEISLRQLEHDKYRLTKKMAERLYKVYTNEGIMVSLDWIVYGVGSIMRVS